MPVLSVLRKTLPTIQSLSKLGLSNGIQLRHGHQKMHLTASRWQWHKYKDLFHFYVMVGVIPLSFMIFFINIYIGPAQLVEIPEAYHPDKWEYYKHPISRWMAKNLYASHQEEYEKYLSLLFEEDEKKQMRLIHTRVKIAKHHNRDTTDPEYYAAPNVEYWYRVRKDWDERKEYGKIPGKYY